MLRESQPAAIILVISVFATVAAWRYQASQNREVAEQRFSQTAQRLKSEISAAMTANGQALRGGAALFDAAGRVTQREWQRYVTKLELPMTYPGIQGMAYASVLRSPESRNEHERAVRATGLVDYAITPPGDRPFMVVVEFTGLLDPRFRRTVGFDQFTEPVRRQAIERARDSGDLALSGKVILNRADPAGAGPAPGVVLFLPVYARDRPLDTPQDRQAAVEGVILSPFAVNDLVQSVLARGARSDAGLTTLEIYDGVNLTSEARLYGPAEPPTGAHVPLRCSTCCDSQGLTLWAR